MFSLISFVKASVHFSTTILFYILIRREMYYSGILIILNLKYLGNSQGKNTLTFLCSPQSTLPMWRVPCLYLEGRMHPYCQRKGSQSWFVYINKLCYLFITLPNLHKYLFFLFVFVLFWEKCIKSNSWSLLWVWYIYKLLYTWNYFFLLLICFISI